MKLLKVIGIAAIVIVALLAGAVAWFYVTYCGGHHGVLC